MAGMVQRELFGGNMSILLPPDFIDVSEVREVPDNQEVFTHSATDQSIIIEILQYVPEEDPQAVRTHFQEVAENNNASGPENSQIQSVEGIPLNHISMAECGNAYCLYGHQFVAKFNETAKNQLDLWLGIFRLKQKDTDILVTFNDPQGISPQSSSHPGVANGVAGKWTPEQFKECLRSLRLVNPDFLH